MSKTEQYTRQVLNYLLENYMRYFKVKRLEKNMDLNRWKIIDAVKLMKKKQMIEKVGNTTWLLKVDNSPF